MGRARRSPAPRVVKSTSMRTPATDNAPAPPVITANALNTKVYAKASTIPNAGTGLFARQAIAKGELVCTYGGRIVDPADARYMDPTYMVSLESGKGFKLCGDNARGDLGHFANAVYLVDKDKKSELKNRSVLTRRAAAVKKVIDIKQNARFQLKTKRIFEDGTRGDFRLVAVQDIAANEEIFVNYGDGYWTTMEHFTKHSVPQKPQTAIARDERSKRREEKKSVSQ